MSFFGGGSIPPVVLCEELVDDEVFVEGVVVGECISVIRVLVRRHGVNSHAGPLRPT